MHDSHSSCAHQKQPQLQPSNNSNSVIRIDFSTLNTTVLNEQEKGLLESTVIDENGWFHIPGGTLVSPRGVIYDPHGNKIQSKKPTFKGHFQKDVVDKGRQGKHHKRMSSGLSEGGPVPPSLRQRYIGEENNRQRGVELSSTGVFPLNSPTVWEENVDDGKTTPRHRSRKIHHHKTTKDHHHHHDNDKKSVKKKRRSHKVVMPPHSPRSP